MGLGRPVLVASVKTAESPISKRLFYARTKIRPVRLTPSSQLFRAAILNIRAVLMLGVMEQNFVEASPIKDFAAF
jgi:hypothetical protein